VVPSQDAAASLGISVTTLKQACKRHGIQRWPRQPQRMPDTRGKDLTLQSVQAVFGLSLKVRLRSACHQFKDGLHRAVCKDLFLVVLKSFAQQSMLACTQRLCCVMRAPVINTRP